MGRGCDWSQLRRGPGDYSERARKDARSHEEKAVSAAERRLAARRAGTTVLHVLAGIHVEVRKTLYSVGSKVHRRLLWYHSLAYQADLGCGARGFAKGATCGYEHWRGSSGA